MEQEPITDYEMWIIGTVAGIHPKLPSDEGLRKSEPLSAVELEILRDGGARFLDTADADIVRSHVLQDLAIECRKIAEEALNANEVATLLEVSAAEIQSYARRRPPLLHQFELELGRQAFPKWQFTNTGVIPHLHSLLSIAESNTSLMNNALTFSHFMRLPNPDLEDQSKILCPRDWLIAEYNPDPVLNLVRFFMSD